MKTFLFSVRSAVGQQSDDVKKNHVDASIVNILDTSREGGLRKTARRGVKNEMFAAPFDVLVANPIKSPADASNVAPPSRKKSAVLCSDFFETCTWDDNEDDEDAAEHHEYLVRRVNKEHPGLSPRAFEKKIEELDAVEKKESQVRQKTWLDKFYERVLAGAT